MHKPKRKILVFIDWYYPGYQAGGPIKSVYSIVTALKEDFDFYIVTSAYDLGVNTPYTDVPLNQWTYQYNAHVMYLDKSHLSASHIKNIIRTTSFDMLYVNAMYSLKFTHLPIFYTKQLKSKTPILIAPRGMLKSGALNHKATKKKVFLFAAKTIRLFHNLIWHATSPTEKEEIQAVFGEKVKIKIASNLSFIVKTFTPQKQKEKGSVHLFFVGRVSPIKNILFTIQCLNQNLKGNVRFDILGPMEDEAYWVECQSIIKQLPPNIQVNYLGPSPNTKLEHLVQDCHWMISPTLNENFGHSIIESWALGCPVILSNNTPWRNLLEQKLGWDLDLQDMPAFVNAIQTVIDMDNETYQQWSNQALQHAQNVLFNPAVIAANRNLFE